MTLHEVGRDERAKRGELIRKLRKRKGWSGADLATATSLSRGYIGDIETGRVTPSLEALQRIARALEVSPAVLLNVEDEIDWERRLDDLVIHLRGPALDELAEEQRREIADFIDFVRSKRKKED